MTRPMQPLRLNFFHRRRRRLRASRLRLAAPPAKKLEGCLFSNRVAAVWERAAKSDRLRFENPKRAEEGTLPETSTCG